LRPTTKRAGERRKKKQITKHKQNKNSSYNNNNNNNNSNNNRNNFITRIEVIIKRWKSKIYVFTMVTISILVIGRTMTIRNYDNKEQLVLIIIQLNSYLFTRKLNNPETNYKVSTSTKNETRKR
jgi:hypothetical protein